MLVPRYENNTTHWSSFFFLFVMDYYTVAVLWVWIYDTNDIVVVVVVVNVVLLVLLQHLFFLVLYCSMQNNMLSVIGLCCTIHSLLLL